MPTPSTVTAVTSVVATSVAATQPVTQSASTGVTATTSVGVVTGAGVAPQNADAGDKSQPSSHSRDRDRVRERSRSRERSRRDRSRSRDRRRDRSRDRHGRDRSRDRGRDRSRSRGRDRDWSRSRGRDRSGGRDRSRGRHRDRSRSHDRDRRRSRERSRDRSRDRDKRDDGKRRSRWDTDSSSCGGQDAKQQSAANKPPAPRGSAASVQSLLTAGRMATAEQPAVTPLMSTDIKPPSANVSSMHGRVDPSYGLAVMGERGPGNVPMASGMANPSGMVGPNDQTVGGPNLQRFSGNASNMATNSAQGEQWNSSGSNFGGNAPNMVGMPQGPRVVGPDAGAPFQMGNTNDTNRFRGPGFVSEPGGSSSSGRTTNFTRQQGMNGRFPPPGGVGKMQGFGDMGGPSVTDNFDAMERSGPGMPGLMNNNQVSVGGGMRMPMNADGPRGFAAGHGFPPGRDSMSGMQDTGPRMMFGNNSRMPVPNDRAEVDGPRGPRGMGTGPPRRLTTFDEPVNFPNMSGMQGGEMQSGGGNFTNMPGGMMNNQPEFGMTQERMPNASNVPRNVRPFPDDTYFGQSGSPCPPSQVPPPLMTNTGKQGSANSSAPVPPPPPPVPEIKNPASLMMPQTFAPAPVGVPAPMPPSQGSVSDQQTAEMQAAMAYYYAQWMQQQQQPQPPPPPPPPPK